MGILVTQAQLTFHSQIVTSIMAKTSLMFRFDQYRMHILNTLEEKEYLASIITLFGTSIF